MIFCGTPLSVTRKSCWSRLWTMAPRWSRTVAGAVTRVMRAVSLVGTSGGVCWIGVLACRVMGPAGAWAKAVGAENKRAVEHARRIWMVVSIARTKAVPQGTKAQPLAELTISELKLRPRQAIG